MLILINIIYGLLATHKYENIQVITNQIFTTSFVIEKLNQSVALFANRNFFNLKTASLAFNAQYAYNNKTIV